MLRWPKVHTRNAGEGVVKEIKSDGTAVIKVMEIRRWPKVHTRRYVEAHGVEICSELMITSSKT